MGTVSRLIAFPLMAVSIVPAHAADTAQPPYGFSIHGSLRARGEAVDDSFRATGPHDEAALFLRTRIALQYDTRSLFIGGEIVDSRVYLEKTRSIVGPNDVDTLEPVQAYLGARLGAGTKLTVGRFVLPLGSQRLVADANFRNTTNGFTGVRFDWKSRGGDSVTGFWTMPQQHLPSDRDDIHVNDVHLDKERTAQQFFGGTATKAHVLGGSLEGYIYRLYERDDGARFQTRNRQLWTYGGRLFRAPKARQLDFDLEAARQTGSARATTAATDLLDRDVDAGFAHLQAGYTLAAAWTPRLALAFDYGSGEGAGPKITRFDGLFGSRTGDFGPSSLYNFINAGNLVSVEGRLEVKPDKRTDAYLAARPVWTDRVTDSAGNSGLKDASGRLGHFAGFQLEGRYRYWLQPDKLRLAVGTAVLFKGQLLKDAAGAPADGPTTKYGYLELTYGF